METLLLVVFIVVVPFALYLIFGCGKRNDRNRR